MDVRIINGAFTQSGLLSKEDKYERAERLIASGADAVFELPVYDVLEDKKTFSAGLVSIITRLKCVDNLPIHCDEETLKRIREICLYLFAHSREFQSEFKKYHEEGLTDYEARGIIAEGKYENAKALLTDASNMWTMEYIDMINGLYSPVKPLAISGKDDYTNIPIEETEAYDRMLFKLLQEKLSSFSYDDGVSYISDIANGSSRKGRVILDNLENLDTLTMVDLAKLLYHGNPKVNEARRLVLRILIEIKKIDDEIFGLYTYAPYTTLLAAKNESIIEELKEKTWVPILYKPSDYTEAALIAEELNSTRALLTDIDKRADELALMLL